RGDRSSWRCFDPGSGLGWRPAEVEEDQPASISLHWRFRAARLDVGVEGVNSLHRCFCFSGAAFGIERFVKDLELLDRLGRLASLRELVGQHQANVVLAGAKVSELLERLESVGVATGAMHPIG